jgi:hypothetical protein
MNPLTLRVLRVGFAFALSPLFLIVPFSILAPRIVEAMHVPFTLLGFDDVMFGLIFKTFGLLEIIGGSLIFCGLITRLTFGLLHRFFPPADEGYLAH